MSDPGVTVIGEDNCIECGHGVNRIGTCDGEESPAPAPGDYILCIRCGGVQTIDADGKLRPLSSEERTELAHDHEQMAYLRKQTRKVHFVNALLN